MLSKLKPIKKPDVSIDSSDNADVIGEYPKNVHVPALEERKALWITRAFAIGMYVSLSVNIILAFTIYSLSPLKEKIPMLISVSDKNNQLVKVEPFPQKGVQGFDLLVELAIKDYILHREAVTIYEDEMNFNWNRGGYIDNRSSPETYQIFLKQLPAYQKIFASRIRRDVEIIPDSIEKVTADYWTAKFKTIDTDTTTNQQIGIQTWKAQFEIDFLTKEVNYQDRFMNPLGFTVMKYSISKIEE